MIELKPISKDTIPAAFERAERYRLMNEPMDAESICHDILNLDPGNQQALKILLLALSEQFGSHLYPSYEKAMKILSKLENDYFRAFYAGIIYERRAKAHMKQSGLGNGALAYEWFRKAMHSYETAIDLRPSRNDDAVLRWNTCARIIMQNPDVKSDTREIDEHMLE